ncbi:uncharacterized protein LOC109842444 [Asparagus officinalis]|uniref:uncharacterized protein LOC109842444 n=1 Tax=Asparagus officinalis TaxID=4686 RepID=UPI00098E5CEC|nr:uncharacterized protein LOC109842444 [Asparagus officinalis]
MKQISYLMVFNIIIRYKKGTPNKLADILSHPSVRALLVATCIQPLVPLEYVQMYTYSRDFNSVFKQAKAGRRGEYEIGEDGLLYRWTSLCILEDGDQLQWIREAHTSRAQGHFGIQKTLLNLRRHVFWPKMLEDVTKYVGGCKLCCILKPSNQKRGLYPSLPLYMADQKQTGHKILLIPFS